MTSALNLSLLARGVGEVKHNGHEKIDVVLEPGDYYNFSESRIYLPPLQRKTQGLQDMKRLQLPKTFITRKGALLLFSEDLAYRTKDQDQGDVNKKDVAASFNDFEINTVDDLAKSILSYGGAHHKINLHFVKDGHVTKRVRPGFSARRYLSKLTRSFDESFLANLLSKGYVNEKSIFQTNSLLPNLRKRINDDLSYMPAPYRLMRQMLLAPGMLSGYSFYKQPTDSSQSDLTTLVEEDEDLQGRKRSGLKIVEMKDGVAHPVVYSELPHEDKENVLADLLVKSAISHALEKQKQILETRSYEQQIEAEEQALIVSGRGSNRPSHDDLAEFDMGDAVKSYIVNQLSGQAQDEIVETSRAQGVPYDTSRRAVDDTYQTPVDMTDTSRHIWLPRISEDSPEPVDYTQYYNEARGRQRRGSPTPQALTARVPAGGSTSHMSTRAQQGTAPVSNRDMNQQEEDFPSRAPVLPPIHPDEDDDGMPLFSVEPPTPQHSTLTDKKSKTVRKHKDLELAESDEEAEAWPGQGPVSSDRSQKEPQRRKDRLRAVKKVPTSSQPSVPSGSSSARSGPVLGAGSILDTTSETAQSEYSIPSGPQLPKFRGKALKAGGRSERRKDKVKGSKLKGSVVVLPGGDIMNVGGAIQVPDTGLVQISAAHSFLQRGDGADRHGHGTDSAATSQEISEQELVHQLSDQAHRIAAAILSRPGTGMDLVGDAQKVGQIASGPSTQAVEEYKAMLKETINTALIQAQGDDADLLPADAHIDEEVVMAIAHLDDLGADDLEVVETESGQKTVRIKSSRKAAIKEAREKKQVQKEAAHHHVPSLQSGSQSQSVESSSPTRGQYTTTEYDEDSEQSPGSRSLLAPGTSGGASAGDSLSRAEDRQQHTDKTSKKRVDSPPSGERTESKSGVSTYETSETTEPQPELSRTKSKITSKKEDTKEEFVVGAVHDNTELQRLYGPVPEPEPKSREAKKLRVHKAGKKPRKSKSKERSRSRGSGSDKETSPTREKKKKSHKKKPKTKSESSGSKAPSEADTTRTESRPSEEEEMEFIIIRDEFSDSDAEEQPLRKSTKPIKSKATKSVTDYSDTYSDTDSVVKPGRRPSSKPDASLHTVSSKEARAAERTARANKRREEVERKRRDREELQKQDKHEMDERERMQHELEEELRRKEEERRMARESVVAERRRRDQEEADRERRLRLEGEREKKVKEEYARKLEIMRKEKEEDDRKRKALEAQRRLDEEERRREEEIMLSAMNEEDRIEYLRKKAEEEERMRIELEQRKLREAEEVAKLEEEARFMAEEMARRQAEMERRLQFNRSLHLEADGLDHTHNITEAFTWSYYELLQWLGLDLPDFERMKFEPH